MNLTSGDAMEATQDKRRMTFDFYLSLLAKNSTKHNHKETSAWTGLASFLIFCTTVAGTGYSHQKLRASIALTFLLIITTLLAFLYLKNQLHLKNLASARIASSTQILAELILDPVFDEKRYTEIKFVSLNQGSAALPAYFLEKQRSWTKDHLESDHGIQLTKVIIYGLWCVAAMAALIAIWLNRLPVICL